MLIDLIFSKIVENVYAIAGQPAYANVTAIVLPEQVVLVDCGIQLSVVKEVRKEIEETSGKKVEVVLLTHFHSDHTYALSEFSDCRIISSKLLSKNLRSATRRTSGKFKPIFPNETFNTQMEIKEEEIQLVIKQTGGHTDCSTYIYCPNYGIVAAGDNLVWSCYPWGARKSNPDVWVQTLKEYLSLDAEHFIPGHGPVGGKEKISELRDYFDRINGLMMHMITLSKSEKEVLRAVQEIKYSQSRAGLTHERSLINWFRFWQTHFSKINA